MSAARWSWQCGPEVMGLFIVAIIFGGRVAVGHQAVQTAAADAARSGVDR